jgi:hypothetical protein
VQDLQLARAIADLLLQFALGALFGGFVLVKPAFRQAQLVAAHAGAVFAHQQDGFVVEHRHDDHRTQPAALQSLVGTTLTIGELQIELLGTQKMAVLNVSRGVDDGWFAHFSILACHRQNSPVSRST